MAKKNEALWNFMYEEAQAFFEENGHLEVPARYVTASGNKLGVWIRNQKRLCDPESERGIRLSKICMSFHVRERKVYDWNEMYLCAVDYFNEHGDLEVPASYVTSDGKKLGQWLNNQRKICDPESKHGKLLLQIGMHFDIRKRTVIIWDDMFNETKKYLEKNGNLNVPERYVTSDGKKLGVWLHTQKKYCDPESERGQLLSNLGFSFETKKVDDLFFEKYRLAEAFFNRYGNLEIPATFKTDDGITNDPNGKVNLGMWVAKKRERCNPESEQGQLLSKIGMRFETRNMKKADFKKMIKLLSAYYEEYGNVDVPYEFRTNDGVSFNAIGMRLGKWLYSAKKNYSPNSIEGELLMSFCIKLEKKDESTNRGFDLEWLKMFRLAAEFYKEFGCLEVPRTSKKLFEWLSNQKELYRIGTLASDRILMLESIGIVWNPRLEEVCINLGIDYGKNKDVLKKITYTEFKLRLSFIDYLNEKGYDIISIGDCIDIVVYDFSLVDHDGKLNEIFSMSIVELEKKFGDTFSEFNEKYEKGKQKRIS